MNDTQTIRAPATRFYFKNSDAEILKWLSEYHYLQPVHFEKLSGRNMISLRRRLRQLHEQGYVERLTLPLAREAPITNPPDQFVYFLSRRGVNLARQYGFADDHLRHNPEKSNVLLPHDVFISTFHLTLYLAARATANLQLTFWEQRRALLQHEGINPDALFSVKDTSKPADQNTTHFFLEVVRARESEYDRGESNFLRKIRGFLDYHRRRKHQERWGIINFRVLTVTPTRERAVNLCRKLYDEGLAFKRFWFTDATKVLLHRPDHLLQPIFITPKDFTQASLYSFPG